jgi:hypothetical protein
VTDPRIKSGEAMTTNARLPHRRPVWSTPSTR